MSVDDLTQCDSGVFSAEFRGRYVEKEAFKKQGLSQFKKQETVELISFVQLEAIL